MKETKNIYISDYHWLFLIQKTGPVRGLLMPSKSDYRKQEKEQLTINKDLTDDHLTATYWG
ncbi:MAG: hypothetical protein ABSE05_16365 [Syntrophales bacterium]|jgi:hypothetical protein